MVITQTLPICREVLGPRYPPHPYSICSQWPFLPQQRFFFPGRCRLSSTKWTPPTTRLSGVCWHPYPKKSPSQDWHERTEKGSCLFVFGTVQHCGPVLLQMPMTSAFFQQGRENKETYHCTFFWWHLPDASLQSMRRFSICQGSTAIIPKKGLGKAGSFHAVFCCSARTNIVVGSSSDPMVIGQGARDCLPGQSLCTNRQQ